MQEGRLGWVGTPAELFRQPAYDDPIPNSITALSRIFYGIQSPQLPVTVEETWQIVDELGLSFSLSDHCLHKTSGHAIKPPPVLILQHMTYSYEHPSLCAMCLQPFTEEILLPFLEKMDLERACWPNC